MKRNLIFSYTALLMTFLLPANRERIINTAELPVPDETPTVINETEKRVPRRIKLLSGGEITETDTEDYIFHVVTAEMPAAFNDEALKAQAVAARSYAMWCVSASKHGEAEVCTDSGCCQAWQSDDAMKEKWGADYELYSKKIQSAVNATAGEYLSYDGQAVFAAFHSSSAGKTEASRAVWSELPYLVSVSSPETEANVPNYISVVECETLDFRDSILHDYPNADMTGEPENWIRETNYDASGRVQSVNIGGVEIPGTAIRTLFSLRSTAFETEYRDAVFRFTVTGYGHGVGMSQYGANVMAQNGSDYREILLHYYPGVEIKVEN